MFKVSSLHIRTSYPMRSKSLGTSRTTNRPALPYILSSVRQVANSVHQSPTEYITVLHLVKKFLKFYGIRSFNIVFTTGRLF